MACSINANVCNDREAGIHDHWLRMLERHELDAFVTLAEELHFGRTAQRLRVSTARISQTIRKMERRVGVPLFHRTSRRVELTAAGRELYNDVQPAWAHIAAGFRHAVETGRGTTGLLRVGFVGAAGGQFLTQVTELFRNRHTDCEVQIREAQIGESVPWLRDGVVDVLLTQYPMSMPDLVTGGVLISEARTLAVPAQHPLATRTSVSVEDLAGVPLLRLPPTAPFGTPDDATPATTPDGRPVKPGPAAATFQELLTLVGAGHGVFPVGAHVRRYYARPDVAYVFFSDAPPVEWGLAWARDGGSARVLAFHQAALDLVHRDHQVK
jgi:DNA-binding transcriptional LysR family regulator